MMRPVELLTASPTIHNRLAASTHTDVRLLETSVATRRALSQDGLQGSEIRPDAGSVESLEVRRSVMTRPEQRAVDE